MAVTLEGSIKRWVGHSDDIKPTEADATIPAGSSFLESDTGHILRWNGDAWVFVVSDETVVLLGAILDTLEQIKDLLELSSD